MNETFILIALPFLAVGAVLMVWQHPLRQDKSVQSARVRYWIGVALASAGAAVLGSGALFTGDVPLALKVVLVAAFAGLLGTVVWAVGRERRRSRSE